MSEKGLFVLIPKIIFFVYYYDKQNFVSNFLPTINFPNQGQFFELLKIFVLNSCIKTK